MLDPQENRRQLFDALRPPDGYQLDQAIGTTYSLDLLALLTVPLAYTFWGGEDEQGQLTQDPLALLHGLRQTADRLTLFCQAGQISVPKANQRLFAYLEDAVFEVTAPHQGGVFHPKVWFLRYIPQLEPELEYERSIRYRMLCLSRNLTFDYSWDTILVLDGVLQAQRKKGYSQNHPLSKFIKALPKLTLRNLTPKAQASVDLLSEEVRKVQFESPWPQADFEFIPMGLNGRRSWPFRDSSRRQLIVSPFVTPGFLKKFSNLARQNVLISRLESLTAVTPENLIPFSPIYVLDPASEPEEMEEEAAAENNEAQILSPKSGLHAKLFICEYSYSSVEMFTGSANATGAAFHQNVEFMVKFTGKGAQIGIDKLLATDKKGDKEIRFIDLLEEYSLGETADESDPVQAKLEHIANTWKRQLAMLPLQAIVLPKQQTVDTDEATFDITLKTDPNSEQKPSPLVLPENVQITCWPITRYAESAVSINNLQGTVAEMSSLSYAALTSFFAFAITAAKEDKTFTSQFVLNLPLLNAPEGRREQILRFLLDNQNKVLSYLMFLLAENEYTFAEMGSLFQVQNHVGENGEAFAVPVDLFESLARALHKNPTKLDHIYSLVTDLKKADKADLLPAGFEEIWSPIWEARQILRLQTQKDDPA